MKFGLRSATSKLPRLPHLIWPAKRSPMTCREPLFLFLFFCSETIEDYGDHKFCRHPPKKIGQAFTGTKPNSPFVNCDEDDKTQKNVSLCRRARSGRASQVVPVAQFENNDIQIAESEKMYRIQ